MQILTECCIYRLYYLHSKQTLIGNTMKLSHYTTPRTLAECTFEVGYAQGPARRMDREDRLVITASVIAAAIAVVMMIWG